MSHRRSPVPSECISAALITVILFFAAMSSPAQTAGDTPVAVPGNSPSSSAKTRLDQLQAVLKKAEVDGDARREAGALLLIGEIYLMTGDSQTAMNNLSRALPIVQSLHLKLGEANVLMDMGDVCREQSKMLKALEYDDRALALFRELHNRKGESNVLNNIAIVDFDLGENQKALEYFTQALAMFQDLGDHASEAMALNNLGRLYHDMAREIRLSNH
jgi:tetratricopeptide (TPR) repeat protein